MWFYHIKYVVKQRLNPADTDYIRGKTILLLISYFILNRKGPITRNINKVLAEFSAFSCVGHTDDYEKGMNLILKMTPDIIFIDIDAHHGFGNVFSFCQEINGYIQKSLYMWGCLKIPRKLISP